MTTSSKSGGFWRVTLAMAIAMALAACAPARQGSAACGPVPTNMSSTPECPADIDCYLHPGADAGTCAKVCGTCRYCDSSAAAPGWAALSVECSPCGPMPTIPAFPACPAFVGCYVHPDGGSCPEYCGECFYCDRSGPNWYWTTLVVDCNTPTDGGS